MKALLLLLALASPAMAQHDHHATPPETPGWRLHWSGQVFLTLNVQERKFTDFRQVESQNWGMLTARHSGARTTLSMFAMASAEPFTLRRLGSAQVFQAGESLDGLPLRDYQHPHDLLMGLGVRVERRLRDDLGVFVDAGLVGSPELGPSPFMHRASALVHPTAPLSHHVLDSSHITPGVLSTGLRAGGWTLGASAFQGREPDEDRLDVDLGPVDSWSLRLARQSGRLRAQVSVAQVESPDSAEPGDVFKSTASAEYVAPRVSWTLAVGRTHRADHDEWGWLAEMVHAPLPTLHIYSRAELIDRFILVDFTHAAAVGVERHLRSRIGAITLGVLRQWPRASAATVALGVDVTLHHTPANLRDSYGTPVSVHAFLRLAR